MRAPLLDQVAISGRAAESEANLKIAVIQGVGQGLFQGNAHADPVGLGANAQANGLLLQVAHQRLEQRGVVLQVEDALRPQHALDQAGLAAILRRPP